MTSIGELLATGEAWATDLDDFHALHTPQPAHTPAPPAAPVPPRVQLGFRDGTSTTLDPESTQSRALEQLAQTLTRRD